MKTSALILLLVMAGCSDSNSNNNPGQDLGTGANDLANAPDLAPMACLGSNCVVINTSHFNPDFTGNGTINTLRTPDLTVTKAIDTTLDPDTAIHSVGGKVYMLNQDTGSLRIYDPSSWQNPVEISTGDGTAPNGTSFPRDFYVNGTKVYVAFSGNQGANSIGVLDTTQPNAGVTKWIAVPAATGDTDGAPEAGNVYACNGKLYVSYADYFINGSDVTYPNGGRIATVDLSNDTLGTIIQLTGKNAGAMSQEGADCSHVLVATSGNQTSVPDGTSGIERVNLGAGTTAGLVMADTALNGRPIGIDVASATLAFVIIDYDPEQQPNGGGLILASTKVIAVNPTTLAVTGDVTGKAGFVSFARVSPDGKLYVGAGQFAGTPDPTKLATGVYIGPADGTMLTMPGIDFGQTPAAIEFE
jgi:hypothetical protein